MSYIDSITKNLPTCTPPGVQITLTRLGRLHLQFRVGPPGGGSFLLRSNKPDIFKFPSNAKKIQGSSRNPQCTTIRPSVLTNTH